MKLKSFKVTNFQSIRGSNPVEVGDVTCLVGKNEAGKTALLKALYRLNPIVEADASFNVTDDYPRVAVEDYRQEVEAGTRQPDVVISATFVFDDDAAHEIAAAFGPNCLVSRTVTLDKDYANKLTFSISVNEQEALRFLISSAELPESTKENLVSRLPNLQAVVETLTEPTAPASALKQTLERINQRALHGYIYDNYISSRIPKFLYFDEYYQMRGHENIETLLERQRSGQLKHSDHPLLGLLSLARLKLDDLLNPDRTIELRNKLEGASNHLSKRILQYWSQNRHLQMRFDVRPARPQDPEGMQKGTNIWGLVYDTKHMATTELGTRSRGFVWFFSFLAWYSEVQRRNEPIILLLDEPGLTLHGRAQGDLLRYFEIDLKPHHQLIYTTHSPFMVDPKHFEYVRIVQDRSIDADEELSFEEQGTKVLTDVLEASEDTLFPLQGALGYDLHQTLFVGPNCLVVEGVSDLLYLQTMSGLLEEERRTGLRREWTITPVGGSDKVPTFVALLGAQRGLTISTLIDVQKKDRQTIENLYRKKLLKQKNVLTFADFTGASEADIEDMFDASFYVRIVNQEYRAALVKPLEVADLDVTLPRIVTKLDAYFLRNPMQGNASFSHFRPARYLAENASILGKHISKDTMDRFEEAFKAVNALL